MRFCCWIKRHPYFFEFAKMERKIRKDILHIVTILHQKRVNDIHAFLGFDACIDNIVRVVKDKNKNNEACFFANSRQFGEFLISRENKSCGIELRTQQSKIGGNMVSLSLIHISEPTRLGMISY